MGQLANVLTANSGTDTLTAGTGVATMFGGAGNDTFVVNNVSDVVQDTFTTTNNTISSSVNYMLPTNVNNLIFTGTSALKGTANNGTDTLTSNTGVDTPVGGTGTDTFVVKNSSDVVAVGSTAGNDTIQSSVNFVLPANVQYLALTGSSSISGAGNSLTDLITGNTGNDTLTGGTGIAVLEGGTAGSDQIKATGNQAALIGGGVTAGQVLLRMDPKEAQADSESLTTAAALKSLQLRRIDAELTGKHLRAEPQDPPDLFQRVSAQYADHRSAYEDNLGQANESLRRAQRELESGIELLEKLRKTNPSLKAQADSYEDLGKEGYALKC